MSSPSRLASIAWTIVALGVLAWLGWAQTARVQRIETVTRLAGGDALAVDPASPTGYEGGKRLLIVPERGSNSYQWIAQTQQMLATDTLRLRRIDYDNAPLGRDVTTTSPYRWWLGLYAAADHLVSGRPMGISVERAALWAGPVLQVLLLAGIAVLAVWRFGAWAGGLGAVVFAAVFPLGGSFAAGLPNDRGLVLGAAVAMGLLLLAGVGAAEERRTRWFLAAGVAGGLALWVDAPSAWPLIAGLGLGGLAAAWWTGSRIGEAAWRAWACGGAATTLAAYLAEFYPDRLGDLRLGVVHPLFGVAWIGLGEVLVRLTPAAWSKRTWRSAVGLGWALLAMAALPVGAKLAGDGAWWGRGALVQQFTQLGSGIEAENTLALIGRDGSGVWVAAALLPLLLLGPAAWSFIRGGGQLARRTLLLLAAGPLAVAIGLALVQVRGWMAADAMFVVLVVAALGRAGAEPVGRGLRVSWALVAGLAAIAGLRLLPPASGAGAEAVTARDLEALMERDLAYWLANRAGSSGAVVVAPPVLTASLCFHGGLRGLATPYPGNPEGFAAAVRIASVTSMDEARALVTRRGITHLVLPTWDGFMDEYARLGSAETDKTLVALLHRWLPPRWLRPVAYQVPNVAGFEGQSVAVFEVVDLQDNATALAHLAEYFAEMGMGEEAGAVAQALAHLFPDEPVALLARAQVAIARADGAAFGDVLQRLEPRLSELEEEWPWAQRVSLAVVLAEAKRRDEAQRELRRCLDEIDEAKVRALSTVTLFRLQRLCRGYREEMADRRIRELARALLPPEMRDGL